MGKHEDIGYPKTTNPEGHRDDLLAQIDRDQRDEAVAEMYDEAVDIYWQASDSLTPDIDEEGLKAVLRLAWERWNK